MILVVLYDTMTGTILVYQGSFLIHLGEYYNISNHIVSNI